MVTWLVMQDYGIIVIMIIIMLAVLFHICKKYMYVFSMNCTGRVGFLFVGFFTTYLLSLIVLPRNN